MTSEETSRGRTPLYIYGEDGGSVIIQRIDSLPLSSRTPSEVLEDHATEIAFQASQNRSNTRRKSARFDSQFVVDFLDKVDRTLKQTEQKVAKIALQHIKIVEN